MCCTARQRAATTPLEDRREPTHFFVHEVAGKDFDRQVSVGDHAHRLFVTGSLDCHHQGANVVRTHRVGGVAQRGACVDRDDLGLANGRNAHGGSGNEWCDATLRH